MTEEAICTSCRKFVKYIVREAEDYITMCDHKGKNHHDCYNCICDDMKDRFIRNNPLYRKEKANDRTRSNG